MEELKAGKRVKPEYAYTEVSQEEKYELGDNLPLVDWVVDKLEPFQKNFYIVVFWYIGVGEGGGEESQEGRS